MAGCTGRSSTELGSTTGRLVDRSSGSYCYLPRESEEAVRPDRAAHRAQAMDLSDQWVADGCKPDSPLLPLEHAALIFSSASLPRAKQSPTTDPAPRGPGGRALSRAGRAEKMAKSPFTN